MQGSAAMWFDGIGFAAAARGPDQVAGRRQVGYGSAAPDRRRIARRSSATASASPQPPPRRKPPGSTCQWATNKAMTARMLKAGAGSPARDSPFDDPRCHRGLDLRQGMVRHDARLRKIGRPGLPVIVPVTEFRDIFGIALTNMIGGADRRSRARRRRPSSSSRCSKRASRAELGARRPARTRPPHLAGAPSRATGTVRRRRSDAAVLLFAVPATVVVAAVIVFPWLFTSGHVVERLERVGQRRRFVGLDNFRTLVDRPALPASRSAHTLYFTVLAVVAAAGARHAGGARLPPAVQAAAACCARSSSCR